MGLNVNPLLQHEKNLIYTKHFLGTTDVLHNFLRAWLGNRARTPRMPCNHILYLSRIHHFLKPSPSICSSPLESPSTRSVAKSSQMLLRLPQLPHSRTCSPGYLSLPTRTVSAHRFSMSRVPSQPRRSLSQYGLVLDFLLDLGAKVTRLQRLFSDVVYHCELEATQR